MSRLLPLALCAAMSLHAADDPLQVPEWAQRCVLEIRLPGREEPVIIEGTREGRINLFLRKTTKDSEDTGLNFAALNLMLQKSFDQTNRPGVVLTVRFFDQQTPKPDTAAKTGEFKAWPVGIAEAAYAMKLMLSQKDYGFWLHGAYKPVPNLPPIASIASKRGLVWPDNLRDRTEDTSDTAAEVIKAARAVYAEHRVELISRFSKSFLFYDAADTRTWTVTKKEQTRWASVSFADLMYAATFLFEMELKEGKWTCVKIYGAEYFKGE